jgi:tetratricopeptide (TPR) repeat protein
VRRDPKGIKGISPFWEVLKRGDAAYLARDYEQAASVYAEALSREPRNALGHYRLGEAHLARGDMQKAEASWREALNVLGRDPPLRAKILFVLADLRERQRKLPQARQGWSAYEGYLKGEAKAVGHPASAADRKKRIDDWVELQQKYAAVKERITQRLAEVEEQKKQNAKQPIATLRS